MKHEHHLQEVMMRPKRWLAVFLALAACGRPETPKSQPDPEGHTQDVGEQPSEDPRETPNRGAALTAADDPKTSPMGESVEAGDAAPRAEWRGAERVSAILRSRLLVAGSEFTVTSYLRPEEEGTVLERLLNALFPQLDALLGHYSGGGLDGGFKNGAPNAASTLLWLLVVRGVAVDLASVCDGEESAALPLRDDVTKIVAEYCQSPDEQDTSGRLWRTLMGYDAPDAERVAWQKFVHGLKLPSSRDRLVEVTTAALFSPHFLLRH